MITTERKRKTIIDVLFIAIVLVAVYFIIEYIAVWTLPFIIGLLVAIVLQRPVAWLTEKTKMSRGFWSVLLVLVVLCLIFALIALLLWQVAQEAPGFVGWLTRRAPDIKNTFNQVSAWFSGITDRMPADLSGALQNAPSAIIDTVITAVTGFVTLLAEKIIMDGPGLLIASIFSVVASCYITKDYRRIVNFILYQLSEKNQKLIVSIKQLFVTNILKMLRGYIIIMFITYIELFIGLSILKVDYAAALAALVAVLDIFPVVGTGTVLIPWGVISLLTGNIWLGIGILLLYVTITVIRNIIEPRIIGKQVGLPPIVTLIAMYVGLQVFGVVGMMLLPVTIIIIVKLQEGGIIHLWKTPERVEENKQGMMASAKKAMKDCFAKKRKQSESEK